MGPPRTKTGRCGGAMWKCGWSICWRHVGSWSPLSCAHHTVMMTKNDTLHELWPWLSVCVMYGVQATHMLHQLCRLLIFTWFSTAFFTCICRNKHISAVFHQKMALNVISTMESELLQSVGCGVNGHFHMAWCFVLVSCQLGANLTSNDPKNYVFVLFDSQYVWNIV